ncbi:hypothetical protein LINPERHAP1_LOCUS6421 [Linum perenne]
MDIGFVVQRFTWTNFHVGNGNIKERLDRALCTRAWRQKFENAQLFHKPIIGSDHCPLRLKLVVKNYRKPTPFRFDHRWHQYPSVMN